MTDAPGGRLGVGRRQLAPIYFAGFVTAFGAHAVAANLGLRLARHRTRGACEPFDTVLALRQPDEQVEQGQSDQPNRGP